MPIFLETSRLILCAPTLSDLEDLLQLQSNPHVMKYIDKGVRDREQVLLRLNKAIEHYEKHGFSLGSVYGKNDRKFVGRAGLIHLAYDDTQPEVEIGYALLPETWGKGYATELAQSLIHWGFKHLTVNQLVGITHPENIASQRVLQKCGMQFSKYTHYWDKEVKMFNIVKEKTK